MGRPLAYLSRIRDYYQTLGYGAPYRFAAHEDAPFTRFRGDLPTTRVAIVTTAAPLRPEAGDQGPGAAYNGAAKFFQVYRLPIRPAPDVRISHIAYDRDHTHARDPRTWLPVEALSELAQAGEIAALTPHLHGLPTNRSQRRTAEVDAQDLLANLRADGADAAIFAANCPVCHQSCVLAARIAEAAGIPTVVMGCASDIIAQVRAPRFVFSDYPLGNPCARPFDAESGRAAARLALWLLRTATGPASAQVPLTWAADDAWKADYSNAARLSAEEIARRRAEFDRVKAEGAARKADAGAR